MNIALLAHNDKTDLMAQFCVLYREFFNRHNLYVPDTIGRCLQNITKLPLAVVFPEKNGCTKRVGSLITHNEINMVLHFCDASGRVNTRDVDYLARICDQYNVPFASNVATAEVLIRVMQDKEISVTKEPDTVEKATEETSEEQTT